MAEDGLLNEKEKGRKEASVGKRQLRARVTERGGDSACHIPPLSISNANALTHLRSLR